MNEIEYRMAERIASALERIADALEGIRDTTKAPPTFNDLLDAYKQNEEDQGRVDLTPKIGR